MKPTLYILTLFAVLFLCACSKVSGSKPLAHGSGNGAEYATSAPASQFRIAVRNSFTRDVTFEIANVNARYIVDVPPVSEYYLIIPNEEYTYTAYTQAKTVGSLHLEESATNFNGISGKYIKVKP
jgi:hypothetical protein